MKTPPLISVITISFNQAAYLRQCIDSVLAQDFPDLEYIVVDPGSTDGSRDIIASYGDRISQVILTPDDGPADGLNKALSACRGRYLYYLNSDDVVLPGAFREAMLEWERRPDLAVVYGHGLVIDQNDRVLRRVYSAPIMTPLLYALGVAVIVQQAAFLRVDAVKAVGGFNTTNRTCWDGELFLRLAMAGHKFRRKHVDFGCFRIYPGSISGSGRLNDAYEVDQARLRALVGLNLPDPLRLLLKLTIWSLIRILDWQATLGRLTRKAVPLARSC
ncbi:glycosyltransferase family 2 protein [Phenylobacterium sp. J367]|uniref:glycosyltransferase family 2 protein n=1 Tax=Phenylobacterium sp. J367 TaxID=2898435 RepID=UPI002151C68D|nr:glycosyltransferase family 2 protein [Phenylobacterium sp. J367]MCR5879505.1 glycosyltransferase [Phenylobacterium sp. J367]